MSEKIGEGELAIKITAEGGITGGLGAHPKGTVLRNLSESAFNTLKGSGFGEVVAPGTAVTAAKAADATNPAPTGTGKK